MTHAEMRAKIDEGLPFTIHVADGRSFQVPHRDFIWLPPKSTVVAVAVPDDEDPDVSVTHTLPLLMVSGVAQRHPAEAV